MIAWRPIRDETMELLAELRTFLDARVLAVSKVDETRKSDEWTNAEIAIRVDQ